MPKLNRKQLFAFQLKLPSLSEQRWIVAKLEASYAQVSAMKKLQADTAAELDALLPSILDKAFKWQL
jgi:type I restriction enzyme S subunit